MKKYEMTSNVKEFLGHKLFQIRALKDFGDVKTGDLGGYIEKEENLSHGGNAWVFGNARVSGNARIHGNAKVYNNAKVFENAWVFGKAKVYGNTLVCGNALIYDNAQIYDDAEIYDSASVYGNAQIYDSASVYGNARVFDDAQVLGNARVCDNSQIYNDALICDSANYIYFKGFGSKSRNTTMFRTRNGNIIVKCGCFTGNLKEFSEKIKETHGNTKYANEYLACIEAAKIHFEIDD